MIFRELEPDDYYGLKVLKDGYNLDKTKVSGKNVVDEDVKNEDKLT